MQKQITKVMTTRKPPTCAELTSFGALTRSELMARCRSTGNETTEGRMVVLLKAFRLAGWRRHLPLPGKPDFAWPKEKVALFVDGCFWHGHDCGRNVTPKSNADFWRQKIATNQRRDRRVARQLQKQGWTVLRVWECTLQRRPRSVVRRVQRALVPH